MPWTILVGDVREQLATLPDQSVQCVCTSPPYWGLRDYGAEGQIGLEPTPDAYVQSLVSVFREVWRVLKDDGVLWLNLGDSYAGVGAQTGGTNSKEHGRRAERMFKPNISWRGLKQKDLVGIPWRVAFALQAEGWYLRLYRFHHVYTPTFLRNCNSTTLLSCKTPDLHKNFSVKTVQASGAPAGQALGQSRYISRLA